MKKYKINKEKFEKLKEINGELKSIHYFDGENMIKSSDINDIQIYDDEIDIFVEFFNGQSKIILMVCVEEICDCYEKLKVYKKRLWAPDNFRNVWFCPKNNPSFYRIQKLDANGITLCDQFVSWQNLSDEWLWCDFPTDTKKHCYDQFAVEEWVKVNE